MLPMSTTRYVVKCEVTPPPGPWETLAGGVSEEVSLCWGGFQARRVRKTLLSTCPLN